MRAHVHRRKLQRTEKLFIHEEVPPSLAAHDAGARVLSLLPTETLEFRLISLDSGVAET